MFVALCPELDITSQGNTHAEAQANLIEAVELFFECASPTEQAARFNGQAEVSQFEVRVG